MARCLLTASEARCEESVALVQEERKYSPSCAETGEPMCLFHQPIPPDFLGACLDIAAQRGDRRCGWLNGSGVIAPLRILPKRRH